jgi:ribosome-binding factor A
MVSPDLRNCKVYWVVSFVTGVDRQVRISEVEEALSHAAGLFKRILAKQLNIRFVPDIRFYYDDTLDTVEHVEQLMNKIRPAGE